MLGRTDCNCMVAYLLCSKNWLDFKIWGWPGSFLGRYAPETCVMVIAVEARFRFLGYLTRTNHAPRAAISRTRRRHGVLAIMASWFARQQTLAIAENRSVLLVRERPASQNQTVGLASLVWQLSQGDNGQRRFRFNGWQRPTRQCRYTPHARRDGHCCHQRAACHRLQEPTQRAQQRPGKRASHGFTLKT